MKPSRVIGGVVGVGIVLAIIITVSWLVFSNETKPIAGKPDANKTHETTTNLPSTEAATKTSFPLKPTEKDNTNDTSPTTNVSSISTAKDKVGDANNATVSPRTTTTTTTDQSKKSTNFFIYLDALDIWTQSYSVKNDTPTKMQITDSPTFSSNFTKEVYNTGFTSDCSNKRIYILKKSNSSQSPEQVLDVIQYDDNNKFQTINRVHGMFNNARSIASDWTTGNIYWIEYINDNKFAIKVTNKLFNESNYVIQPTEGHAGNHIQFYPKEKKLFFSNGTHIWYVSISPNSTAYLLFSSSTNVGILDLAIDYAFDKLYWLTFFDLKCMRIGDPLRPDNIQVIPQDTSDPIINLAVFNKRFLFYRRGDHPVSSMKNSSDTSKSVAYNVTGESSLSTIFASKLFFFPQECIV